MVRNRWGPRRGDGERIRRHLERQKDYDQTAVVVLDTGEIVPVGADAEGEDDECQ